MENHAALWTHGDMAHRFLSSTYRFSARFAFIFTVSLSCTYLCYSILFCRSTIMTNQGYEGKRCPPSKNAGGKKLLGKLDNCASLEVRSALDEAAAQRGSSDPRDPSKAPASSGSHWADMKLRNMSVVQKYGNKKLPNALIVGVKKGGTRAVLEFIRIHPDVRALGTEPHFFDRNYDRGLDWYRWGKKLNRHLSINCINVSDTDEFAFLYFCTDALFSLLSPSAVQSPLCWAGGSCDMWCRHFHVHMFQMFILSRFLTSLNARSQPKALLSHINLLQFLSGT